MGAKHKVITLHSVLERSDNKLWGAHLRIPQHSVAGLVSKTSRRIVCSLNDGPERQCALLPDGNGDFLVTVNKSLRTSLGLNFGDRVLVRMRKDDSKYGLPMPAELAEVFRQDPAALKRFHTLTPGRQRTLLYIVNSGKNVDDRIFRAVTVTRHLEVNKGGLNYRKLYVELRKAPTVRSKKKEAL